MVVTENTPIICRLVAVNSPVPDCQYCSGVREANPYTSTCMLYSYLPTVLHNGHLVHRAHWTSAGIKQNMIQPHMPLCHGIFSHAEVCLTCGK